MKIQVSDPEAVVKEAFWLAWKACGGTFGMGALQDNPRATKDDVWNCMYERRDYPGGNKSAGNVTNKTGKVYGDYVFGRMMKLGIEWDETSVTISDGQPRPDYQAWCVEYPTYQDLIQAAVKSIG